MCKFELKSYCLLLLCVLYSTLFFLEAPDANRLVVLLFQIAGAQFCFALLKRNARMKRDVIIAERALDRMLAIEWEARMEEKDKGEEQ